MGIGSICPEMIVSLRSGKAMEPMLVSPAYLLYLQRTRLAYAFMP